MSFEIDGLGDSSGLGIRNPSVVTFQPAPIRTIRAIVVPRHSPRSALELSNERHACEKRARDEHVAVISHELRNALGVVRNASLLLDAKHAGRIKVEVVRELIERQVIQISRHLDDLMKVTQTVTERFALQLRRTDLCEIARHSVVAFGVDLARRGHRLTVRIPQQPLWLEADGCRLEQILANLMINAAKYTPDGGEITLCVERQGEFASVCIRDTGIGIAPEMLTAVFGLFVQVDGAALHSEGGRGVGLALAHNFVEMHGGRLSAASAGLGMGSEFTILLPAPNGVERLTLAHARKQPPIGEFRTNQP
jgi:signal transduction histidine kinase